MTGKKMETIKTRPIGATFRDGGNTLQVVASDRVCFACYFYGNGCRAMHNTQIGDCSKFFRTDFTDVIFKKI